MKKLESFVNPSIFLTSGELLEGESAELFGTEVDEVPMFVKMISKSQIICPWESIKYIKSE